MRKSFYVLTALAGAGLYAGEELVKIHIATKFGTGGDTGLCAAAEGFSCSDVARHALSSIAGLPIAALGEAFYLTLLLSVFLIRFLPKGKLPGIADSLLVASTLGVLYSVFLGVASKVLIGKLCPWCMVLYAINLGVALTLFFGHPEGDGKGAFKRALALPGRAGFWAVAGLMALSTLGAQAAYAHRAEKAHQTYLLRKAAQARKPAAQVQVAPGNVESRGPADAPVTIIEFSDFECPYCQILAKGLKQAQQEGAGPFKYHFRHWPMDDACNPHIKGKFHEDACNAAYAAECARQQGRFWEMHDTLFDNRRRLKRPDLQGYAQTLGLDPERFGACLDDPATKTAIQADIAAGRAAGVGGTPMWFINGWLIEGARPPADLIALIEQAAENAKAGKAQPPK
ncbi:MAG: thioredoxin domain-containing protein [Myxococcales bacterium]|nr:thioredoxin domain-containing protein [Myxococcales bacterium]MCB9525654.1 thioredoxin domain-containing protein [Myxococcales bacterium]